MWITELKRNPDFDMTLKRFEAWWHRQTIDRPPVTIWATTILAVGLLTGLVLAEGAATDRFQKVGERLVKAINAADYGEVKGDLAQVMLDALPKEKAEALFKQLTGEHGKVRSLGTPRLVPPNQTIFAAQWERGDLSIRLVLDEQDKVIGLWFAPPAPAIPLPEKHETDLSLPFKGRWLVFWGGDTKQLNQHHDVPNQRFAFDLLGVDADGKTHKGDGKANEDYACFGRPILAPADGTVTDVIDGVRDNVPGSMNPYSAVGNAVVIQHREHECSVLAHLRLGTVKVKVGDQVKRGQELGLCGNSGNSSEPHLHHHLQNTPVLQDGTGIKVRFAKVAVIGKDGRKDARTDYSPVKGDVVEGE
jgi:hypothetical protein